MASSLRIGAAWYKRDKNGNEYLSLSISTPCPVILQPDQRLSLFPNPNKQTDNQPDFDLVILPDAARGAAPQAGQQFEQDDFSPEQAPRQSYGAQRTDAQSYGQGRSQAPEDVRPAPPRQPTRQPAGTPPPRATRQPAPPPDYDTSDLEDPFAEGEEPSPRGTRPPQARR